MESLVKFRYLGAVLKALRTKPCHVFNSTSHLINTRSLYSLSKKSIAFSHITSHVRNYAKKAQGKSKGGGKQKVIHLSDEEISQVIHIEEYRSLLLQAQDKLKKDFVDHLSLRSAASNIDNLIVKVEDEEYPLNELAQISKKNPNLIAINMTDFPEALKPTIQAIIDSGSEMNPQQEGTMIYLSVPKVTREHREKLAKNAKTIFTKAKEGVREIQNSFVREAKRKTDLSEDLVYSATQQIMSMAEQTNSEMEKILKSKQKELTGDS